MNPINILFGETVEVLRGTEDRVGDKALTVHHTIEQCVFWPSAIGGSVTGNDDRRDTSTVQGELAIPRDAEILATDHVRRTDGTKWSVVGPPQWDMVHPMTGWDTGYKIVRLKGVF